MAYLEEITQYKEKLMQAICQSEDIVELLKHSGETLSGRDMRYKRIFPYAHVPNPTQDAQSFVCFEVRVPATVSGVLKLAHIYIYALTHQSLMRTNEGVLIDVLASKVDKLLNGNTNYGIGKLELLSSEPIPSPAKDYHGRRNVYAVQDFNRVCGGI